MGKPGVSCSKSRGIRVGHIRWMELKVGLLVESELRAFGSIEAEKKLKNRLDFAVLEFDAEVQAKHSRV